MWDQSEPFNARTSDSTHVIWCKRVRVDCTPTVHTQLYVTTILSHHVGRSCGTPQRETT